MKQDKQPLVSQYREVLLRIEMVRKAAYSLLEMMIQNDSYPEDTANLQKWYDNVADEYYKTFKEALGTFRKENIESKGLNEICQN